MEKVDIKLWEISQKGQDVVYQNKDGTYTARHQNGKVEIFNYADDGKHIIIKTSYVDTGT